MASVAPPSPSSKAIASFGNVPSDSDDDDSDAEEFTEVSDDGLSEQPRVVVVSCRSDGYDKEDAKKNADTVVDTSVLTDGIDNVVYDYDEFMKIQSYRDESTSIQNGFGGASLFIFYVSGDTPSYAENPFKLYVTALARYGKPACVIIYENENAAYNALKIAPMFTNKLNMLWPVSVLLKRDIDSKAVNPLDTIHEMLSRAWFMRHLFRKGWAPEAVEASAKLPSDFVLVAGPIVSSPTPYQRVSLNSYFAYRTNVTTNVLALLNDGDKEANNTSGSTFIGVILSVDASAQAQTTQFDAIHRVFVQYTSNAATEPVNDAFTVLYNIRKQCSPLSAPFVPPSSSSSSANLLSGVNPGVLLAAIKKSGVSDFPSLIQAIFSNTVVGRLCIEESINTASAGSLISPLAPTRSQHISKSVPFIADKFLALEDNTRADIQAQTELLSKTGLAPAMRQNIEFLLADNTDLLKTLESNEKDEIDEMHQFNFNWDNKKVQRPDAKNTIMRICSGFKNPVFDPSVAVVPGKKDPRTIDVAQVKSNKELRNLVAYSRTFDTQAIHFPTSLKRYLYINNGVGVMPETGWQMYNPTWLLARPFVAAIQRSRTHIDSQDLDALTEKPEGYAQMKEVSLAFIVHGLTNISAPSPSTPTNTNLWLTASNYKSPMSSLIELLNQLTGILKKNNSSVIEDRIKARKSEATSGALMLRAHRVQAWSGSSGDPSPGAKYTRETRSVTTKQTVDTQSRPSSSANSATSSDAEQSGDETDDGDNDDANTHYTDTDTDEEDEERKDDIDGSSSTAGVGSYRKNMMNEHKTALNAQPISSSSRWSRYPRQHQ